MAENTLTVWAVVSKSNKLILFSEEPKRDDSIYCGWLGPIYINSIMYKQLEPVIKQSEMNYDSEPEQLVFSIKQH